MTQSLAERAAAARPLLSVTDKLAEALFYIEARIMDQSPGDFAATIDKIWEILQETEVQSTVTNHINGSDTLRAALGLCSVAEDAAADAALGWIEVDDVE